MIRGRPIGLLQFPAGEAVKICFASVSPGIRAMCPNRDRRLDWTMAERWGCLVNTGGDKVMTFSVCLSVRAHDNCVTAPICVNFFLIPVVMGVPIFSLNSQELRTVASIPSNLESKSGATSPSFGLRFPQFLTQVFLSILGFFPSRKKVLLRV